MTFRLSIRSLLAGLMATGWISAAELPGDPVGGARIAEQMRQLRPLEGTFWTGVLQIRRADRTRDELPVTCEVVSGGDRWRVIYTARNTLDRIIEKLVVHRALNEPIRYEYWPSVEGRLVDEPKMLAGHEANIPFAGSDFWLTDLGMEFFHWPVQRQLPGEMRRSQPCLVLDSFNPRPTGPGYFKVRSWIEKDHMGLLLAEAYDREGDVMKEFSPGSFVKDDQGNWHVKELEIVNRETGSRTSLEFDIER